MTKRIIIAGTITLISLFNIPFVPSEAHLEHAYQYQVGEPREYFDLTTQTTLPTPDVDFVDDDGNGVISVAVFSDYQGNSVYVKIPDKKYEDIGKKDGWLQNPKRTDYSSIFDVLIPQAEAAIAIGNLKENWVAAASSITLTSYAATGTTNAIVVSVYAFNSVATYSSSTFNGGTTTMLGYAAADGTGGEQRLIGTSTPSITGNFVLNWSANKQIFATGGNYTGVDLANAFPSYGQTLDASASSHTMSTTTATDGQWLVAGGRSPSKAPTAGANTVVRDLNDISGDAAWLLDSNTALSPAGSWSINWSYTGASRSIAVMLQLKPEAVAGVSPAQNQNIILFE